MNKTSLKTFATSLTSIMFLVIAISGVMLYFHILKSNVKEIHEVMGMAFVVVAFLHVFLNFKSMKKHFAKKIFLASFIAIGAISMVSVLSSGSSGPSPKTMLAKSILKAPISDSLKVLNINYSNASKLLEAKGIKIQDNKSISELANTNEMSPYTVVGILTNKSI